MQKLVDDLLKNKEIKKFVSDNKLNSEDILNNYPEFALKDNVDKECARCLKNGLCNNETEFARCILEYDNGQVKAKFVSCIYEAKGKLVTYFDENIPSDVFINDSRIDVFKALTTVKNSIEKGKVTKGVYIYGGYGQGKSVILYNFAKELIKCGKKVIYAYYPDLVRRLKSSIGTNDLEALLVELKKVDILMLDDLGGENNTSFVRDEILGPILQYRMNNYLPTFATSNYSVDALIGHFAETTNEQDKLKAGRIVERIRSLMQIVELKDKDYRNEI